jgi:putative FmdB family regulatory protein
MPIYAFACPLNHNFELRLPMSESDSQPICPTCGGQARRMFTMPFISIQWPDASSRQALTGHANFRPEGAKEWQRGVGRAGQRRT